ncbi:hypothetical protein [uncultured Winogradskyella sp.]|uniref:hypothetical protein n=1 Tax=uncultured Winogradskyella sp. TaxID=395353 RepID=UPI0030D97601|tara:strand:+ start:64 stop:309 length:246 start_codon:yes stop_codon:yes gene_type:complete
MKKILVLFVLAFSLMSFTSNKLITNKSELPQVCCKATLIINGEPGPSATACVNGVSGPETINLVCKMAKNKLMKELTAAAE